MEIILIRHFATKGNKEQRYIGRTDEPILEPINQIGIEKYPDVEQVYVSPMLRCIQTAERIYPGKDYIRCHELRECDFGIFENKNYIELKNELKYQEWVDSNARLPFPGGEAPEQFKERCQKEFLRIVSQWNMQNNRRLQIGFVVHGGTIMSILEKYCTSNLSFYEYSISNGGYYRLNVSKNIPQNNQFLEVLEKKMGKE